MKTKFWIGIFVIIVFSAIIFIPKSSASSFDNINSMEGEINIYKSLTCGCCGIYSTYVDGKVKPTVNAINIQDPYKIKNEYGIPSEMESCHTTIIGDYFVEGHIPLEAVEKLLSEKPDIKGIAMPGMPSGSPGMPGQKFGDFLVYGVNHDGSVFEFTRI